LNNNWLRKENFDTLPCCFFSMGTKLEWIDTTLENSGESLT